jgi:hypothetical protein
VIHRVAAISWDDGGMPERSRKRPRDLNSLAASIVGEATGDTPEQEPADDGKDPAAVALGRKGGLKGGPARAQKLTPEERSTAAKKAAQTRWSRANDR